MTELCLYFLFLDSFLQLLTAGQTCEFCEFSLLNLAQKFPVKMCFISYTERMDYSPEKKYYQRKIAVAQ